MKPRSWTLRPYYLTILLLLSTFTRCYASPNPQWPQSNSEFYSNSYQSQNGYVPPTSFGNSNYGAFNRPFITRPMNGNGFVSYGNGFGGSYSGMGTATNNEPPPSPHESEEGRASVPAAPDPVGPTMPAVPPPSPGMNMEMAGMGSNSQPTASNMNSGNMNNMNMAGGGMSPNGMGAAGQMGQMGYGQGMNRNMWNMNNNGYGSSLYNQPCYGPNCPMQGLNTGGYDLTGLGGLGGLTGMGSNIGQNPTEDSGEESNEIAAGQDMEQSNLQKYAEYLDLVNRRYGIGMPGQGNNNMPGPTQSTGQWNNMNNMGMMNNMNMGMMGMNNMGMGYNGMPDGIGMNGNGMGGPNGMNGPNGMVGGISGLNGLPGPNGMSGPNGIPGPIPNGLNGLNSGTGMGNGPSSLAGSGGISTMGGPGEPSAATGLSAGVVDGGAIKSGSISSTGSGAGGSDGAVPGPTPAANAPSGMGSLLMGRNLGFGTYPYSGTSQGGYLPNIYENPYPIQWPMQGNYGSLTNMGPINTWENPYGQMGGLMGSQGGLMGSQMGQTGTIQPDYIPYGYSNIRYPLQQQVRPSINYPVRWNVETTAGPPVLPPEVPSSKSKEKSAEISGSQEKTHQPPNTPTATSIQALTQQIRRLPAVLYVDSKDQEGRRIENMLRDTYGLPLVSFYVDKIDKPKTVEKYLHQLTAHKGMPYLFICGTFIGSLEHVDNYHKNKQIPQLVEYVCGESKDKKTQHSHKDKSSKKPKEKRSRSRRIPG